MGIEVNGKSRIVTPADGVVVCHAGNIHRFWCDVLDEEGKSEDLVLLLNATDSGKDFVLDRVFFENWYGMRYDSLTYGKGIDLIQMLCVGFHPFYPPSNSLGLAGYGLFHVRGGVVDGLLTINRPSTQATITSPSPKPSPPSSQLPSPSPSALSLATGSPSSSVVTSAGY